MADREKIKIFELDIDIDAAIKSTASMKTEADKLRDTYNELRKSTDASNEEIVKAKGAYDAANREYRTAQREVEKLTSLEGKQIKTIEQARNALSVVSSQWAKQADLYGANSKEADALAKKKLELTERLKTMEKATGDTSRNVGNYTESMKDAIKESGLWQKAQSAVNDVTSAAGPIITFFHHQMDATANSYKAASKEAATYTGLKKALAVATNLGTTAMKAFKVALISTGIGALLVAIGSLVAWLSKTQDGIDFVNKALAALSGGFDVVIQRVATFGRALGNFLSGNFKEGIEGMKDAFKDMGTEIKLTIGLALELEKVMQAVNKEEVNLDIRRAAANARLKELNKTIEDVTKTEEERLAAAREYQRLDEELTNQEVANQERRVAAMLGFHEVTDEVRETIRRIGEEGVSLDQLGIGESTLEDAKEFRDEVSKLYDLQTRSAELQTTNQNKLNTIEEQVNRARIERAKKATEAALKESNTRLQIFIEENQRKADNLENSLQETLKIEQSMSEERLKVLEEELIAGKLTRSEYDLAVLKEKNAYLDREQQLVVEYAQRELDAVRASNQTRIENDTQLTDALINEEKRRLDTIANEEREFQATMLEEGVISQQEYNAAIAEIDKQNRLDKADWEEKYRIQQAEARATDLENRMIAEEENFLAQMEIERQRLEMQRQMEIEEAEKTGASIALINQKYAKINEQIEYELQRAKRDHAQHTFGEIAELLGEQTVAGKAAAVAQATINTYQGVTEVWRSPSILPEPFATIQKLVSTGTVLASGLGAVANIKSTNANVPKAAKGATLSGPSHAQGGITLYDQSGSPVVEAEGGENIHVLNKRASSLLNSLSFINQATGGVPLNKTTSYAAAGGMVRRTSRQNPANIRIPEIDIDTLALKIADANRDLPAPRVAVEEINTGQGQLTRVVSGAII